MSDEVLATDMGDCAPKRNNCDWFSLSTMMGDEKSRPPKTDRMVNTSIGRSSRVAASTAWMSPTVVVVPRRSFARAGSDRPALSKETRE
jgi:hypothetical protein